jgi:uncharacterized membrane protein
MNININRPLLKIALTSTDLAMEIASGAGMATIFLIIILNFSALPQRMPIHYDAQGVPDGFGNKYAIWILAVIIVFVYGLITYALSIPHRLNYPYPITNENAERQYRNTLTMMRVIKTASVSSFLYITYVTIETAKGNLYGLGLWFLPVFLLIIFGTMAFYVTRGYRLK